MGILLIVESPSKARTIKKYVGPDFMVRPTVGHIIDLVTGSLGVDIENGFKPKYAILPDKKDVIQSLKDAARAASEIYIASDPDREGAAISFHVASVLKEFGKPIRRIIFNEITKKSITKAINNPGELDQDLYDAQQARRVLDRIVGFTVSPYLSHKLNDKLSAGRVQSVALRLIVDREKEIEQFVPEEYWDITVNLAKSIKAKSIQASPVQKITTEPIAKKTVEELKASTYIVSNVSAETKPRAVCAPLTTSKMQQDAAAKFKFPADKTMKLAQSLYEAGHVTYIRSDSLRCSADSVEAARAWLTANGHEVPDQPNAFQNKDAAQDAHEAIRPTDINISFIPGTSDDEQRLYSLIRAKFLGSQMKPALYDTVVVTIKASKGHELKAEGRVQKYAGWLAVCGEFEKITKDVLLPPLVKGDYLVLVPPNVTFEKKETKPPSRYNDGTIIKELEKKGIGRPSTYAAIIAKISDRKYVTKTSKSFEPTELGRKVVEDLQGKFSFMEYVYTARMEEQLDLIAEGKLTYKDMLQEFYDPFRKEFQQARGSDGTETDIPCPTCGGKTIVRHSQFGFFAGCIRYPDCKSAVGIRIEDGKIIIQEKHQIVPGTKCPECGLGMVRRDGKFGPYYSCSNYPRCKGKDKIPFGKKCSKCGKELYLTVFNEEAKLACMGYPKCRNVEDVPADASVNWIPPSVIEPPKLPKKVEKALKVR